MQRYPSIHTRIIMIALCWIGLDWIMDYVTQTVARWRHWLAMLTDNRVLAVTSSPTGLYSLYLPSFCVNAFIFNMNIDYV